MKLHLFSSLVTFNFEIFKTCHRILRYMYESNILSTLTLFPDFVKFFILGIMVNGQFKCLGSIQHLKNRFGSGYSLTVRCQENNSDKVQKTLEDLLPHAQLQEEHYTQMKYQLPVQSTKLPLVFRLARDSLSQFSRITLNSKKKTLSLH